MSRHLQAQIDELRAETALLSQGIGVLTELMQKLESRLVELECTASKPMAHRKRGRETPGTALEA